MRHDASFEGLPYLALGDGLEAPDKRPGELRQDDPIDERIVDDERFSRLCFDGRRWHGRGSRVFYAALSIARSKSFGRPESSGSDCTSNVPSSRPWQSCQVPVGRTCTWQ